MKTLRGDRKHEMTRQDYVAFLSGIDLVITPFIWFFIFRNDFDFWAGLTLGQAAYLSGGKFFIFFILWQISFFLANLVKKATSVVSPLHAIAAGVFILLFYAILFIVALNDAEGIEITSQWLMLSATILLPTVVTYLLLLLRIRLRPRP